MLISLSLILALIQVESNGDRWARGLHGELGILQVKEGVIEDVNRIRKLAGTKRAFRHRDAYNVSNSIYFFRVYIEHYAPKDATDEQIALIWRYGPTGAKNGDPDGYWPKVKAKMSPELPRGAR